MMPEVAQDDLAWDYTADECSPLLRRAVSPNGRGRTLTRNQARYLVHSLSEAVQILNTELRQRSPDDGRITEAVATEARIYILYRKVVKYLPLVIVALQILAVFIETVIDASSGHHDDTTVKPYTAAVLVSFGAALMILFYVDVMHRFFQHRASLFVLFASFISSSILFANIYTVFYCFDKSVWYPQAAGETLELYVVTFLKMVHVSISVFTFSQDASGMQVKAWYPLTILSIQMMLAYSHLLIIIVLILDSFLSHTKPVIPSGPIDSPPQRDPDAESLSFGTHLSGVVNSNPVNVRVQERIYSEEQDAALLSNSI